MFFKGNSYVRYKKLEKIVENATKVVENDAEDVNHTRP